MSNALLGCAIGDALGVFAETKLSDDKELLAWDGITFLGSKHHNLLPSCYSDDTQLSIIIAESLIDSHGFNPDTLAQRYLAWFTSGEARGFGRTTAMAMMNLAAGKHWSESGIAGSYGNAGSMRAAPFGIFFRNDLTSLVNVVKMDSAITHVSDEAEAGAIAIALAAAYAVNNDTEDLLEKISEQLPNSNVKNTIISLNSLINDKHITPKQALKILGTKADVRQTVPVVLYSFLKFNDYQEAAQVIIRSGGDTDTNFSIFCALYGAHGGKFSNYHTKNVENSDKLIVLDSQLYNRTSHSFFTQRI